MHDSVKRHQKRRNSVGAILNGPLPNERLFASAQQVAGRPERPNCLARHSLARSLVCLFVCWCAHSVVHFWLATGLAASGGAAGQARLTKLARPTRVMGAKNRFVRQAEHCYLVT